MKRFWIMLLAVALALVIALPVGAGKPDCSTYPDGHPLACDVEPPIDPDPTGGFTCVADPYTDNIMFATDDFVIELGGRDTGLSSSACVDVLNAEAGLWQITVTGGGARSLALTARDSHGPGDSCGRVSARGEQIYGVFTLQLPAATVNACGIEFAEWIDEIYPRDSGSPWNTQAICTAANGDGAEVPCEVSEMLDDPHPLVLQASFQGSKTAIATIHVDLPPYEDG